MEPLTSPTAADERPTRPDSETPHSASPKRTPAELLRTNWMAFAGVLVLLIVGGLFMWLKSAQQAAQQAQEPVAAASANIEPEIRSVETAPPTPAASPSANLEAQRRAELDANQAPAAPTEADVADVFAVDTTGRALRQRRRAQAAALTAARRAEAARRAAADVDTIETTLQDPATGSYHAQTLVVPRHRLASGNAGNDATRGDRRRRGRSGKRLLPARDTDGTPFETDPDVNQMLANSPPATREAYERMTGKRYRDPQRTAQLLADHANAPSPGPTQDGFNTVKVGNSSRLMAQGGPREQLVPDVFFKGVINGEQKVRTGSVVLLRLLEDAVVSGVTFPKNLVFAGVASVGPNSVQFTVSRLGPTRVEASIYDFNYLPGIAIDPEKRVARDAALAGNDLQLQTTRELSTAIDRSASAANSVTGVAGRIGASLLARPRTHTKLRDVLLPDGYPILITTAAAGQMGAESSLGK
ncbi:hypothetical protein GCM10023172_00990 [Hymenobacter ginsengisoli]|uniref:Conjugative transposon TraM C-terminal domain-containing protein n=1 Tax=Hymenobacter ginsengisoli TaxID=1051626 RepID=A0ABP8PWZ6_9BACT|nr:MULTISPECIES: conjugative transposon protein TraM [unclassified Hymenobacter]MBO2033498.1 conjugative transposon protein TraM [Hymenobacter sp. BT559]